MPPQKQTNSLFGVLGQRMQKAHEAHKNDETNYGIINLPPGITGGVAQLKMAKWGKHPVGHTYQNQPYVTLQGIAVSPEEFKEVKVRGMRVSKTISLCDQPDRKRGTPPVAIKFEDNYAALLNELRKFQVNTSELGPDDIEAVLTALQEQQPFYRFSTRAYTPGATPGNPKPDEMTIVQFDGLCDAPEDGEAIDPGAGTDDGTGVDASTNGQATDTTTDATPGADADGGLTELAELADGGDEEAMEKLRQIAIDNGIEEGPEANAPADTINGATSWAALVDMIVSAQDGSGATPDDSATPEAPAEPSKGDTCKYTVRDAKGQPVKNPRTKKPNVIDAEVVSVDKRTKTVTLKNLVDGKTMFKGVKWDQMEPND